MNFMNLLLIFSREQIVRMQIIIEYKYKVYTLRFERYQSVNKTD